MKKKRHAEILEIIESRSVETQEELAYFLKCAGYNVTQATISRDIRELKLTKISEADGRQKYVSITNNLNQTTDMMRRVIREAVISIDSAGNLLVVKTRAGMGMAVAVAIDEMEFTEILGTIGSDDVVFCAIKTPEQASEFEARFLSVIKKR